MFGGNSNLDLLFRITSDSSPARADITSLRALMTTELGQIGTLGTGALKGINTELTSLARSVPLVGTPLAGITQGFLNMGVSATPEVRKLSKELASAQTAVGKFESEVTTKFDGKVTPAFLRLYNQLPQLGDRINSQTPRFKAAFDSLGGDASALLPKLEKTSEEFAQLEGKVASASGAVSAAGGGLTAIAAPIGIAAGAVVGFGAIAFAAAAHVASFGDEIYKVERKTSFGAGALSVLNLAAKETGTSFGEVGTALTRFERNIVAAEGGNKKLSAAFKNLGINATTAAKNPQEAFSKFLTVFNQLPEGADRAAIAIQLFGRSGANLIPLFDQIGGDFEAATERAKRLGVFLGEDAVQQAHNFEVSMRDTRASLEGLEIQIGQKTLPVIERFIEGLAHTAQGGQGAAGRIGSFVGTVLDGVGVVANDAAHTVSQASQIIGGAYDAIGTTMGQAYTLNKNFVVGLKELATLDFSGFENNVKSTFNTLDKEEGDLLERTKARLKEFAGGTIEGLTGLNNRDLNLKDVPTPTGAKPLDPSTQTASLVAPLPSEAERSQSDVDALKSAEEDAKRIAAAGTADIKRQYAERQINDKQETDRLIGVERTKLGNSLAALTAQRELLTGQRNDRAADKNDADKKQKELASIDKQLIENAQAAANKQTEFETFRQNKLSELRTKERDATQRHEDRLQAIADQASQSHKKSIEAGTASEAAKAAALAQIEKEDYERHRGYLQKQRDAAGADFSLRQEYNDKLKSLEQQRTAQLATEAERRKQISQREFEDNARLQERQLQVEAENLRAFAADQHAQAENELKTYRDAELEIIKAQDVLFDKEIKLAGDRFQQALKLGNEKLQQEITVQKNLLTAQKATFDAEGKRKVGTDTSGGTEDVKDTERDIRYAANLRSYYANIASIVRGGEALDLKEMARAGANRITLIERQAKDERDALTAAYNLEVAALKGRLKLLSIDEATKKKNADEIKAIEATLDVLEKRLTKDTKAIDAEEKRAKERANPASRRSVMGEENADMYAKTGSKLKALGATGKSVFEELSAGAGNMKSMLGDAFGSIGQGLGSMAEAFLVTGEFSGKALAKMLVVTLAHLAAESTVKGLYETAAAYASAATFDVRGAALHSAAAGFYFTVAGISAGAALVGSFAAGTRGGGKNSAGTTAAGGRALGYGQGNGENGAPQYQPFNYNGQGGTFSASQAFGQGSRNTATASALNRVAAALENHAQGQHALAGELSRLQSISPDGLMEKVAGDASASYKAADAVHGAMKAWHPLTKAVAQISEGAGFD